MNKIFPTPARRALALMAATPLLIAGAGCSGSGSSGKSAQSSAAQKPMASSVQMDDAWAKASDSGMSAAFGTLKNSGARPVTITKVSGDHGPMQLHVTQKTAGGMEMRETKAFTVPAGGRLQLKPGGNHMMFMDLTKPLKAGDNDRLTVAFQDGSRKTISLPIRAYDGAKEKYSDASSHGSSGMSDMSGMTKSAH